MGYNHERIKSNGRIFYKNNTSGAILSYLIYVGITAGAEVVMMILTLIAAGELPVGDDASGLSTSLYNLLNYGVQIFLLPPLAVGLYAWYRNSIYRKVSLNELFAYYTGGRYWGCVGTYLLVGVYTFLWTLLFIVPGIIKAYSYSQALYIKGENPNISSSRAIELSKIMTDGYKGKLFYLDLSFFGWNLLSALTFNILGIVYVYPYYQASKIFAYEELKAEAFANGKIDPAELCAN